MSVRMRHTSSHTKNRRSHHALVNTNIVTDKKSGALRLPHRLDETTGMYRGKLIVPERKKVIKEEGKRKAKNAEHKHEAEKLVGHKEPAHLEEKQDAKVAKKGILGRMTTGGRAKARSGFGGNAGS